MSELRDAALFRQQILDESARIENEKINKEKVLQEEAQAKYDDLRYTRKKVQEAFCEYKRFVKNTCLEYAIAGLMETALANSDLDERDMHLVSGFIKGFINEQGGATTILSKAAGRTYIIDCIKEACEEECEEIVAKADPKNPNTFVIDKEDLEKMMNKLDNCDDYNEVKSAIAVRVVGAEDAFVTNSIKNKEELDEVIANAEEKTAAVEADPNISEEFKDAIKEEIKRKAKQEATRINTAPRTAVFDEMVRKLMESSVKTGRKYYINEATGGIDSERVVNSVKIMYSLMEALSTSKLLTIDEKFINETLENL